MPGLHVPQEALSFFQPGEFLRERKAGEPFQLKPIVVFPPFLPNSLSGVE